MRATRLYNNEDVRRTCASLRTSDVGLSIGSYARSTDGPGSPANLVALVERRILNSGSPIAMEATCGS